MQSLNSTKSDILQSAKGKFQPCQLMHRIAAENMYTYIAMHSVCLEPMLWTPLGTSGCTIGGIASSVRFPRLLGKRLPWRSRRSLATLSQRGPRSTRVPNPGQGRHPSLPLEAPTGASSAAVLEGHARPLGTRRATFEQASTAPQSQCSMYCVHLGPIRARTRFPGCARPRPGLGLFDRPHFPIAVHYSYG